MHRARHQFKGVISAIITPYDRRGRINEALYRKVVDFNINAGIDGFWVAGGTGESVLLTDEERIRLGQLTVDQARGRAKTILHVGALTTRSAARMAEGAAKAGAEAIAAVPPFFYRPSDKAIVEHYKTVAAAADLPLFLYNLPSCTGVEITPPLASKIAEVVPQLAGIKHSVWDLNNFQGFVQMDLAAFIGISSILVPALSLGGAGTIDGFPCVFPEVFVETYKAYREGDQKRAEQAQKRANGFNHLIWPGPFGSAAHSAFKTVLTERLGEDCGKPRPPLLDLTPSQKRDLLNRVTKLKLM
jgi:dihydrodipicolinate synthase/N-acetylneuraminate lyase